LGPVGVCADATAILQRLSSIKADAAAAAADSPASSAAGAADAAESRAKAEKALQQLEAAKLRVVQGRVTSPDGVLVSDVSVNLSLFYLHEQQPEASDGVKKLLDACVALFERAKEAPLLDTLQKGKPSTEWVRWEEFVSRLACLAFHMYLVQSCYGVKRPETAEACRALIGMEAARDFLLAHIDCSRQPERFLEGLAVLELCGTSTEDRLAQWYGRMRATPKHVYPESLQPLFDGPHAQPHCNTSQALGDIVHMYDVILLYGTSRRAQRCRALVRTPAHARCLKLAAHAPTGLAALPRVR
jgi:hypothetical protein